LARTGDDGLIYLLGRADSQIKSRGYRIELGEIEAALYGLGRLRECAVVSLPTGGFEGNAICCAYVDQNGLAPAVLREQLAHVVPGYMLPVHWMKLDALPLNSNGKVDRPLLKQRFQQTMGKIMTA
jgi:acyl-coenzyme A synthetase/AMP-(fatty) acid ligase